MVGWEYLIQEFCYGDIVVGQVLGHGNAILLLQELCNTDIVVVKELRDGIVEEFCDRDIIFLQELGKRIRGNILLLHEFGDGNVPIVSIEELGDCHVIRSLI